jgi:hypothetical protein
MGISIDQRLHQHIHQPTHSFFFTKTFDVPSSGSLMDAAKGACGVAV